MPPEGIKQSSQPKMKDSTLEDVVIVAALLTGWALLTIARAVLVPALALLLTVAGWRPAPSCPPTLPPDAPAPDPLMPVAPDLGGLPVAELRRLARASGLKQLARTGRRAELLVALAPA
jgi:hypothetical protein